MNNAIVSAMQSMQAAENENLRFIEVTFATGSTRYTYKTIDTSIEEGDKVVVYTPSEKFEVVTVRAVKTVDEVDLSSCRYKFIVGKIDTTVYEQQVENEDRLLQQLRNRQRNVQAKRAAEALLEGSTAEEQESVRKLVRL